MPRVMIRQERCKGCELCVYACPQNVLAMSEEINEKGYFFSTVADQPRCIGCRLCAITCPDQVIEVGLNGVMVHYFEY